MIRRVRSNRDPRPSKCKNAVGHLHIVLLFAFVVSSVVTLKLLASNSDAPTRLITSSTFHESEPVLGIYPGELPGYTGWARPEYTLAPFYRIIHEPKFEILSGTRWRTHVRCNHDSCRQGGAHFYIRLYGPAVLSGSVHDYKNGSYSFHAFPIDAGLYTVEIVLAFSHAPHWKHFPLPDRENEPSYEGYVIPGFPRQLRVYESTAKHEPTRTCVAGDLVAGRASDGPQLGPRWVVTDKVASSRHRLIGNVTNVSLEGYQHGENSLGILMEYRPRNCLLLPLPNPMKDENMRNECLASKDGRPIHFIFVGDSVARLQKETFERLVGSGLDYRVSHITTKHGLSLVLDSLKEELGNLLTHFPTERRIVLFNSGLHDIHRLCTQKWRKVRSKYISIADEDFSCTKEYHRTLEKLVSFISDYPAELRVFQTTSAGWPKYGNYGFAWPPNMTQPFPFSPNFVEYINSIAFSILDKFDTIHVLDGFWITLARPDNRWKDKTNSIGQNLIHPGYEVLQGMVHMFWNFVLASTSSGKCLVIT